MKYAWIASECAQVPVTRMCALLEVSRSGFYAWQHRHISARARSDARLVVAQHASDAHHRGKYGRLRLPRDLREAGYGVNHERVRRLMLREELAARRRRFVHTTDSRHALPVAPNQKWMADIIYVDTAEGWLYMALVMDLFSRRLVG